METQIASPMEIQSGIIISDGNFRENDPSNFRCISGNSATHSYPYTENILRDFLMV